MSDFDLFLCFEAVSGLKLNLASFELVSMVHDFSLGSLGGLLGCKVSSLSIPGPSFGATSRPRLFGMWSLRRLSVS